MEPGCAESSPLSLCGMIPVAPLNLPPHPEQASSGRLRWSVRRVLLIVGLVSGATLLYLDTLHHPPIWDDHRFVFGQQFLMDCANLPRALSPANFLAVLPVRGSARPVWLASVLLDTCIGDGRLFAYRLASMFWHGVGAALVMVWAVLLADDLAAGIIAGVLFAVHPVHAEAVNIVANRSDLLCLAGMLGSLILYRRGVGGKGWRRWAALGASGAGFALALLSKEMAVTLPLLLALTDLLFPLPAAGTGASRRWRVWILYALLIPPYLVFRAPRSGYVMPGHQDVFSAWRSRVTLPFSARLGPAPDSALDIQREATPPWHRVYESREVRFLTMSRVFGSDLRLLAWPRRLQGDYAPDVVESWGQPAVLASWAAWLLLLWAAWTLRRRLPLASYGLLWVPVSLLPVSGIVALFNLQAERYLYVPSAGFCLAAGAFLAAGWRLRPARRPAAPKAWLRLRACVPGIAASAFALLVVAGAWRTARRNRDYRSELAFFESNRDADDRVPRNRLALGLLYDDQGRSRRAEEEYRAALRLWPGYLKARLALESFLMRQHRVAEAIAVLEVADAGDDPVLLYRLVLACRRAGQRAEAERFLEMLRQRDPALADLCRRPAPKILRPEFF